MEHVRTCNLCEALCGLVIEHDGHRVQSIRGDAKDPLSRGHICPKAVALQDLHEDPDRLRHPVRREGERWVPLTWEAALAEAAERLHTVRTRYGRNAVAMYAGNPTVHNYSAMLMGLGLRKELRTRNSFSATSADQLPHMFAALHMFGHQLLLPVPDLDRTDLWIILGGNPVVSNGSIMTAPGAKRRLKAIQRRGGRVVVIDPRRTETAEVADAHHFIRPGADALLLMAMLHTVLGEGLVADGPWREWTDGLAALEPAARRFTPDRVAARVGIEAEQIRALARELAGTPRAALYGRLGATTQRFGGLCGWLICVLNVITGHLDVPGGMMFARPAVDFVEMTARVGQKGHFGAWRSRVSGLPEFGGELPVAALSEEIEAGGEGQIRALIVFSGNPVLSTPNGGRLARALPGLDTMISVDPFITATSRHAHLILPPLSPLERDHFGLAFHTLAVRNTVKYAPRLFAPADDALDDWQILTGLAARLRRRRLGRGLLARARATSVLPTLGPRRILDLALRAGPYGALRRPLGAHRLTLDKVERAPHGVDLGALEQCLPGRLYTSDKRVRLAPRVLLEDLDRLAASLDEPPTAGLSLIGRRQLRSNNSWLHNSARLVKGKPRCTLLMHPEDAAGRGLAEGDRVQITSRVGRLEGVQLALDDGMMPGVVSLPHGWGHAAKGAQMGVAHATEGHSLNDLTDETLIDQLTGTSVLSGVPVDVTGTTPPAGLGALRGREGDAPRGPQP